MDEGEFTPPKNYAARSIVERHSTFATPDNLASFMAGTDSNRQARILGKRGIASRKLAQIERGTLV
jgi:hypothetical protein